MSTLAFVGGSLAGPVLLLAALLVRGQPAFSITATALDQPWSHNPLVRRGVYLVLLAAQPLQHVFATLAPDGFGLGANIGSSILFPLGLTILLYLYVTQRPGEFLRVMLLIGGMNAVVATLACAVRGGWVASDWLTRHPDLCSARATWEITLGTASTLAAAFIMVAATRGLRHRASNRFFYIAVPLLVGLLVDSAAYSCVLAWSRGWEKYWVLLAGQVTSKWAVGMVYATTLNLLLGRVSVDQLARCALPTRQFLQGMLVALPLAVHLLHLTEEDGSDIGRRTEQLTCEWKDPNQVPKLPEDPAATFAACEVPQPQRKPRPEVEVGFAVACPPDRIAARRRATRALARRWSELMASHAGMWVAVDESAATRYVGVTFDEVWDRMTPAERSDLFVHQMTAERAPVAVGRSR